MMRTFLSLLKISLNLNFSISALKYRYTTDRSKLWEPIVVGLGVLFGGISAISGFALFMFAIFIAGKQIGQPELVLTLAVVASQIAILFFGIFYIMGSFYFSKDLEILLPLPLKPWQVLGSKFAVVIVNEYLTLLPLLLPSILIYGFGTGQGFAYWLKGLVLFLSVPALPLVLGALFVIILMRFVNISRHRDMLALIGGLFGIAIAVGINVFVQKLPHMSEGNIFVDLFASPSGIVNMIGRYFPPSLWATYGMSRPGLEGAGYLAAFVLLGVLLFAVLMWLGSRFFYKSVLAGQEVRRRKKQPGRSETGSGFYKAGSPVAALFRREWKIFLRTPVFLMNGVVGMLLAPFLMLMPVLTNAAEGMELISFINNKEFTLPVTLGALGFLLLIPNLNIVASTSVSREGNMFWISRMIPVSPREQVLSKLLHSLAVEILGVVVTALVLMFVLHMSPVRVLLLILLAFPGTVLMTALNLIVDVIKPRLSWTNPQEAVKKNFNGVIGMFLSMAVLGILSALAVLLVVSGIPGWIIYLVLGFVMTGAAVPAVLGCLSMAEYRYGRIDA